MDTPEQLRAARSLLRWDQAQLARASGVSVETIKRLEAQKGRLAARTDTIYALRAAFEARGIVFVPPTDQESLAGAGVVFADHPNTVFTNLIIKEAENIVRGSLKAALINDPDLFKKDRAEIVKAATSSLPKMLDLALRRTFPD